MIVFNNKADHVEALRKVRERECFSIVNRGKVWYDMLSSEQLLELKEWYNAWLDVTETLIIPEKPSFINEKLQSKEILL